MACEDIDEEQRPWKSESVLPGHMASEWGAKIWIQESEAGAHALG